ncbi:MAG: DivIVA domain-containing protein [Thermoanaerobaculia bacterium]
MNAKITAVEIQKREFPVARKGYPPESVRGFLNSVAEDFQSLVRENSELETRLRRLEEENLEHRDRERILKETLLSAQRISEEMKSNARREADLVVRQAELAGQQLTTEALQQSARVEKAIRDLKLQRANFRLKLRSMIEMFQTVLDFDEEEDEKISSVSYLVRPQDTNAG